MNEHPQQISESLETDERFPSGPWVGFWLQHGLSGRQWMRNLWLRFASGKIKGGGSDWVGPFDLRGHYDLKTGKCTLFKEYLDAHGVTYQGHNDSDGLWVWGIWSIVPVDRGGFHIWPKGVADPTGQRLSAEEEIPAEELQEVGL
jgi:hypothetical protein